ncbi:unnamed protein product [Blepharisma stoltei]|uniref:Uncharacterized protein n=1 Tax=Blepharisma stoltei TaxID=1481888 RepID=A0AAU9K929_9CILI|nr:unnamed protein product [Blepharisma stoltei]
MGCSFALLSKKDPKVGYIALEIEKGTPKVLEMLKSLKDWPNYKMRQTSWSFLHLACWYGHDWLANEMISNGADPLALDCNNETPLHLAAYRGHLKVISVLLKAGSDQNAENLYGKTPYQLAKENGFDKDYDLLENLDITRDDAWCEIRKSKELCNVDTMLWKNSQINNLVSI